MWNIIIKEIKKIDRSRLSSDLLMKEYFLEILKSHEGEDIQIYSL